MQHARLMLLTGNHYIPGDKIQCHIKPHHGDFIYEMAVEWPQLKEHFGNVYLYTQEQKNIKKLEKAWIMKIRTKGFFLMQLQFEKAAFSHDTVYFQVFKWRETGRREKKKWRTFYRGS